MKYKFIVLLVAAAFLLFGCETKNAQEGTDASTTVPSASTDQNTEPTLPDMSGDLAGSDEIIVNPDGSITLPDLMFDDEFYQTGTLQPVIKPSEPETTVPNEGSDPEEDPTEPAEETTAPTPYYPIGDDLPDDLWE